MVDGIRSLEMLRRVRNSTNKPILFNQICGGRSPRLSFQQLRDAGVNMVQYSTPLLFAAQAAMSRALDELCLDDGLLPDIKTDGIVGVKECTSLLAANVPENRLRAVASTMEA